MPAITMIVLLFIVFAVISPSVHGSLQITDHEFPLMHYTELISEEHFTPGWPLVIALPLAEEFSNNKEVGYLIEELHKSGRWPILVYNGSNKMNGIMYTEIHQHGSYIILISGPCALWEFHIPSFWQQLYELTSRNAVLLWLRNFRQTASGAKRKRPGREPSLRIPENIERLRQAFVRSLPLTKMCWQQGTPPHRHYIQEVNIVIKMLWDEVNFSNKFTQKDSVLFILL